MPEEARKDLAGHFGYDPQAIGPSTIGVVQPAFVPAIPEKLLATYDEYEILAGRGRADD